MPITQGGTTRIVSLDGIVDAEAAKRARDTALAVLKLSAGERVVIDCRNARELDDSALALLAASLEAHDGRVKIRGLHEHHLRLLRYLGSASSAPDLSVGR